MSRSKPALRDDVVAKLRSLSRNERERRSRDIAKHVDVLDDVRQAEHLVLYRALSLEVDTTLIAQTARERGQALFYPRTVGSALRFVRVGEKTVWVRGSFGVYEPDSEDALGSEEVERPTVVIVPGIAFSEDGDRLGRGRGYYDRALRSDLLADRVVTIGLAFEPQLLPRIPVSEGDASVDLVVTEKRVIRCPAG